MSIDFIVKGASAAQCVAMMNAHTLAKCVPSADAADAAIKTDDDKTDAELLAELRDRMSRHNLVVKLVAFDEPSPTVDELIADLRRLHGVVVKSVRRVRTESDRLMAEADREEAAKAKAAKTKSKATLAKAAKTKAAKAKAAKARGNGKVATLAPAHAA